MRPAHGGEAVALLENADNLRIDIAFVVALMRNHLPLNDRVGFVDQSDRNLGRRIVKRIGDVAQGSRP